MILALNNKSNLDKNTFLEYQKEISNLVTSHKMILIPTFLNLTNFDLKNISLGSQNVSSTNDGAFTGEISATQLKSYGVEYSIVGHSERRQIYNETNEEIRHKIKRLFENDIIPILCIGETKEERENGKIKKVILEELSILEKFTPEQKSKLIVAYEPIWSIGTGVIPNNYELEEVFKFIKELLPNTQLLYGGSVNDNNIDEIKKVENIDGYLLGGISLKPDKMQILLDKIN